MPDRSNSFHTSLIKNNNQLSLNGVEPMPIVKSNIATAKSILKAKFISSKSMAQTPETDYKAEEV